MSKFGKFKDVFNTVSPFVTPFVPGSVGSILDKVSGGLNGSSPASADAIKQIAADNDEQTQAILALHERVKALEAKLGR